MGHHRWATQTGKYLTQLLRNLTTGRGSRINFYHAPLVDQGRSTTWKKGHLAHWEKMKVRINVVHQTHNSRVGQDLINVLEALHLHASEHMSQDLFKAILGHWIQHPDNGPTELRRLIAEGEQEAHKQLFSSTNEEEYKLWLEKAHQKGLRRLYIPWARPFQHLPAAQSQRRTIGRHLATKTRPPASPVLGSSTPSSSGPSTTAASFPILPLAITAHKTSPQGSGCQGSHWGLSDLKMADGTSRAPLEHGQNRLPYQLERKQQKPSRLFCKKGILSTTMSFVIWE